MGVLTKAVAQVAEQRSVTSAAKPASWLLDALGGGPTKSGARVSEQTAARLSTVFACVRIISEDVGRLPLPLYERLPVGRRRATDHRLYDLITTTANPEMPTKSLRELLTGHAALWGNGYAEIELDNSNRPIALWPLLPNVTRTVRRGGRKFVVTRVSDGKEAGKDVALPPGRYLHIPGPAWMGEGLAGDHPIRIAREAIGLAMAAEEFGARLFGNGARPSGILTSEKKLSPEARRKLAKQWESMVGGLSNAQRTAVLEENLKWQAVTINPDDAQSLETRKFQVEEVARYYRMPLVLLGHTEKATSWGTGIEQFMRGYVVQTLGSWLNRWEIWLPHHLLDRRERAQYYVEHILEDLLKGDTKARFEAYAQAVQNGWMNRNEVRERENMNPIEGEGGDAYTVQLNMAELGQVAGDGMSLRSDGRQLSVGRLEDVVQRRTGLPTAASEPMRIEVESDDVGSVLVTETETGDALRLSWTSLAGVLTSERLELGPRDARTGLLLPDVVAKAKATATEKSRQLVKAKRSLTARRRLRRRFEDVFSQIFARATRREVAALRRLAKRLNSEGEDGLSPEGFVSEVMDFYERETLRGDGEVSGHMAWLAREYSGPLEAFAELVQDEVLEERGVDEKPESAETEVFLSAYVHRFLRRHAARSTNQMRVLATKPEKQDGAERAPTPTEVRERVETRLDDWEEKRPGKLAAEESRHSEGSVSRITYFAVGVLSLEWVAFGENCPLCDELNGQVVGIQEVFLKKGDVVDPDDGETQPLKTKRAILHAPLHLGCDCSVTAA